MVPGRRGSPMQVCPKMRVGALMGPVSSSPLEQVQAQQPRAWERLVELLGPEVHRWARHWDLQPAAPAEFVQEVFLAVASRVKEFRRDWPGSSFRGWLFVIARNIIHDRFRSQKAEPRARRHRQEWIGATSVCGDLGCFWCTIRGRSPVARISRPGVKQGRKRFC